MAKLVLGCTLMVVALLLGIPPASAVEWEHDNQLGVSLIVPLHGNWVQLSVLCTWEKNRCGPETHALLTTVDYVQREIPATLILNAQFTRAVVTLLDGSGSVVTFHAIPGQQQITEFNQTLRGEIAENFDLPFRYIYRSTHNYSYATGTLLGETFDTREMPVLNVLSVEIVSQFTRWLDPPDPPAQAVKR